MTTTEKQELLSLLEAVGHAIGDAHFTYTKTAAKDLHSPHTDEFDIVVGRFGIKELKPFVKPTNDHR